MRLKAACAMLLVALFVFPASVWAQGGVRSAASKARGDYGRVGSGSVARTRAPAVRPMAPMAAPDTAIARTPGQGRVYSYQPSPGRADSFQPGQPGTRAVTPAPTYRSGTWYCPPGTKMVRPYR